MLDYVVCPIPATTGGHSEAKGPVTFTHLFPVHAGGNNASVEEAASPKDAAVEVNAPDQTSPRLSGR